MLLICFKHVFLFTFSDNLFLSNTILKKLKNKILYYILLLYLSLLFVIIKLRLALL